MTWNYFRSQLCPQPQIYLIKSSVVAETIFKNNSVSVMRLINNDPIIQFLRRN